MTTEVTPQTEIIVIRGARMHNLKNVDLDIPRDQFVVLTGPSGSGKSSLAFDTLFAEGQRQYIESLSVYARQFLNQMERPDVDLVEGLPPTLCIDQRPTSQGPRSTVATTTEIYDYLRLLMARLGEISCPNCGIPVRQQSPEQIRDALLALPEGTKLMLLAPLVRGKRGQHGEAFAQIRKAGFVRVRIDGELHDVERLPQLDSRQEHTVEAVVDRIIIRPGVETRLAESLDVALKHGEGVMTAAIMQPSAESESRVNRADEAWDLRLMSTRYACPDCGLSLPEIEPRTFSFNSPYGACPDCGGLGYCIEFDPDLLPEEERTKRLADAGGDWAAALLQLEREYATATDAKRKELLESYRGRVPCRACRGARLRPEALAVKLDGRAIHQITGLPAADAKEFFRKLQFADKDLPIAQPILTEIQQRLTFLDKVGLGYLTLDRPADTLSGGELQRVRLATSIGSGLVGVCYILDEPSIGLHPRDNDRLIAALRNLQEQGNSVVVVEHDEAIMRTADRLIDIGPGAGASGGQIVSQGTPTEVAADHNSLTGDYLSGRKRIEPPAERRKAASSRAIVIEGATTNNLKNVTASFPLGIFTCVTGVSGSGKSSLLNETLAPAILRELGGAATKPGPFARLRGVNQIDKAVIIDQAPLGRSPRSSPATFTGIFDEVRKIFAATREAKQLGFKANRFSFNVAGGRCEECLGQGTKKIEMNFLPDIYVTCEACHGTRYNRQTLLVKYKDRSIADVLAMPVEEALRFFENLEVLRRPLASLNDVGLGYLPLGQPATTLSGGECQRIKLATELARVDTGKTLYLLDEPTTGLHFEDIRMLLGVLQRLVDRGNTVIVIEHNLDVIKSADWLIDLGPDGGAAGGEILAACPPEELAAMEGNATGTALREALIHAVAIVGQVP
jgi:excinuclease ABC subunit A